MKQEEINFIKGLLRNGEIIDGDANAELLKKLINGEVPGLRMKSANIKVHSTTKDGNICAYEISADLKIKEEVWEEWMNHNNYKPYP